MSDPHDHSLQIIFGLVGVLSTILTLAGLHNRDSLGCILFRRIFSIRGRDRDVEPETEALSSNNTNEHLLTHGPRRPTMPLSYACSIHTTAEPPCSASSTPSHAGNVIDMGSNADIFSPSVRTASSTHLQTGNALNAASDTDISISSVLAPPIKPRAGDALDTCVNTVLGHSAGTSHPAVSQN